MENGIEDRKRILYYTLFIERLKWIGALSFKECAELGESYDETREELQLDKLFEDIGYGKGGKALAIEDYSKFAKHNKE